MDVSLSCRQLYEGSIYEPDVLAIDRLHSITASSAAPAFNLSVNAAYPTKLHLHWLPRLSVKRGVGVEAAVTSSDIIDAVIGKASTGHGLSGVVG